MFNMKRISLAVLAALVFVGLTSMKTPDPVKKPENTVVKWLTFEEAIEKSKKEKKKFFIDVYTDWCGWCKVMDKNTFSDPAVAQMLNEKFYPVKFNAEQREEITFNGTTFKYVESGRSGYHELAAALLNNQLSYPTVVFVDENFTSVSPLAGYKKAEEFHKYLMFFAEEHYKKGQNSWKEFEKDYKSPYQKTDASGK
jgi:thioredoxin-related protein